MRQATVNLKQQKRGSESRLKSQHDVQIEKSRVRYECHEFYPVSVCENFELES